MKAAGTSSRKFSSSLRVRTWLKLEETYGEMAIPVLAAVCMMKMLQNIYLFAACSWSQGEEWFIPARPSVTQEPHWTNAVSVSEHKAPDLNVLISLLPNRSRKPENVKQKGKHGCVSAQKLTRGVYLTLNKGRIGAFFRNQGTQQYLLQDLPGMGCGEQYATLRELLTSGSLSRSCQYGSECQAPNSHVLIVTITLRARLITTGGRKGLRFQELHLGCGSRSFSTPPLSSMLPFPTEF